MARATATFTNDTYEEEPWGSSDGAELGKIHITRSFSGDLEGQSEAELLTATMPGGSAVYVAIDAISGSLGGKQGGFVFGHRGTVSETGASTEGEIAPGSGSGELKGIGGTGTISVDENENHTLALDYELG
jgi:hypothetical protein